MKAGFGLLSLLIVAAIIFWVSFGPMGKNAPNGVEGQALQKGQEAREAVNAVGGKDESGVPVDESIVTDEIDVDGQFRRIKVVSVVPGGAFATAYGLQANDEITENNGMKVSDNNDYGLAKAQLVDAYSHAWPLTVVRAGQTIKLTPVTGMTKLHPEDFGKPGSQAVPSH